jgi:hypothetical protein
MLVDVTASVTARKCNVNVGPIAPKAVFCREPREAGGVLAFPIDANPPVVQLDLADALGYSQDGVGADKWANHSFRAMNRLALLSLSLLTLATGRP